MTDSPRQKASESWQGYAALICLLVAFAASAAINKLTALGPQYRSWTFTAFIVCSAIFGVIGITRKGPGNRLCAVIALSFCALLVIRGL
jgi:fatty-acid desaturase